MFAPGPVFPLFLLRDRIGHMPSSSLEQNWRSCYKKGWVRVSSSPTVQEQGEQVLWRSLRKAVLAMDLFSRLGSLSFPKRGEPLERST